MAANMELQNRYSHVQRRKRLPVPVEKEKRVSIWLMIKDNVGKDLTRVCLPVLLQRALSSCRNAVKDMEYSYLLDQAYQQGKDTANHSILCWGKPTKPIFPEKDFGFFSEKVSNGIQKLCKFIWDHWYHCEGRGWEVLGDSTFSPNLGRSIQLDPVEFSHLSLMMVKSSSGAR
ncbi:Oxysterol-binding protein-related protein 2B, partial [Cucurbita argyrosperma subsp. argyrosperma]